MPEKKPSLGNWRKYGELKKSHPDKMFLFRMGDFYEAYSKDAEILAKTLGLTLTTRTDRKTGEKTPMAGFPHHALETNLHKLFKAGIKVAIMDG